MSSVKSIAPDREHLETIRNILQYFLASSSNRGHRAERT